MLISEDGAIDVGEEPGENGHFVVGEWLDVGLHRQDRTQGNRTRVAFRFVSVTWIRVLIGVLLLVIMAVAAIPLLVLIDLSGGGSGFGMCPDGSRLLPRAHRRPRVRVDPRRSALRPCRHCPSPASDGAAHRSGAATGGQPPLVGGVTASASTTPGSSGWVRTMKMATRMMAAPAHPLGVNRSPRTTTAVAARAARGEQDCGTRRSYHRLCPNLDEESTRGAASPVSRRHQHLVGRCLEAAGRRRQYEGEGRGDEELNRSERDNRWRGASVASATMWQAKAMAHPTVSRSPAASEEAVADRQHRQPDDEQYARASGS